MPLVDIPTDDGRLAGRLDLPSDRQPNHALLLAHCFTCSKDLKGASRLARTLAEHGFAVLRIDFTGLGESDGDFADTTLTTNVADLRLAADWLDAEVAPVTALVGHSLGGAAALMAAPDIASARAVATIGTPSELTHVEAHFGPSLEVIEREGEAQVRLAGRDLVIRRPFLEALREHTLTERVAELDRALLVLHSPVDDIVGIEHARRLFEAARHPKAFVPIDGGDHLLAEPSDAEFAGRIIAVWADRHGGR